MAKAKNPVPTTPEDWLSEIARAYDDAKEAIPFGVLVGEEVSEENLFHLAPRVCIKFRGLPSSNTTLEKATEAALSSYVASKDTMGNALSDSQLAFAFCYVASHFGLDLISGDEASGVLEFVENHEEQLKHLIESN